MSTIEMKRELINRIQAIDKDEVLLDICNLLDIDSNDQEVYHLSNEQKLVVAEARNQVRLGNFYTNEEVEQEAEKWLSE